MQQKFDVPGSPTELRLFQHILKKLKDTPTARAAVIVPEGFMFRDGAFARVKA